jgi:Family of unknown function (DUF5677)
MKTLQETFDQALKDLFKPEKLGTELVRKKLKELGIKINESQLAEVKRLFAHPENDVLHLVFEDDQVFNAGFETKEQFENALKNIFNELTKDLERIFRNLHDELPSIVMKSTDQLSHGILNNLKKSSKKLLKDRAVDLISFESNLYDVYSEAFDLLEMLIAIALEAGESFNNDLRNRESSEKNYVFEVLTRLHARACQIAYEILVLLKSGLADGAHARWRSLHEISVTALFISNNGNDMAERYLLHDGIESYKAANIYQENCGALGFEPLSKEEIVKLRDIHDDLLSRFGNNYRFDYGWASGVSKNDNPTFKDIEKSAGLKHLRPYYKMACNNVHANPKGIFFKLGLYPESRDILLAGPSNVGLTDPGQLTALSLAQITTTLLIHQPNIDRLTVCKIIMILEREIGQAFSEAENSIKDKIAYENGVE